MSNVRPRVREVGKKDSDWVARKEKEKKGLNPNILDRGGGKRKAVNMGMGGPNRSSLRRGAPLSLPQKKRGKFHPACGGVRKQKKGDQLVVTHPRIVNGSQGEETML